MARVRGCREGERPRSSPPVSENHGNRSQSSPNSCIHFSSLCPLEPFVVLYAGPAQIGKGLGGVRHVH
ncbi:hypothetical protein MA16_Dca029253 [Dendrobium catenatum]|uniref:Uncharacterized protein n=1 Tax=Dendrobium catenatum TaxID=906689 RepID=A0A2I0VG96_9ASPA|nr:hypothetical protein MA16_Dca029253 [Dendrobium catenatum]